VVLEWSIGPGTFEHGPSPKPVSLLKLSRALRVTTQAYLYHVHSKWSPKLSESNHRGFLGRVDLYARRQQFARLGRNVRGESTTSRTVWTKLFPLRKQSPDRRYRLLWFSPSKFNSTFGYILCSWVHFVALCVDASQIGRCRVSQTTPVYHLFDG
jgi:hypothetical protein